MDPETQQKFDDKFSELNAKVDALTQLVRGIDRDVQTLGQDVAALKQAAAVKTDKPVYGSAEWLEAYKEMGGS